MAFYLVACGFVTWWPVGLLPSGLCVCYLLIFTRFTVTSVLETEN